MKLWQIAKVIKKEFIDANPGYHPVVLQLLWNRGFKEQDDIKRFLNPNFNKDTHDPFLFKNMSAAVDEIIGHIKKEEKITVYGDYDADGVTSTALLVETLGILRAEVDFYIPHRVSEGYGFNMEAIEKIAAAGTKLIISVDNGMRGQEEISRAQELGIKVIVTDHHIAPEGKTDWPDCLVINPILSQEKYPYKYLAGAGVAYKLCSAIISRSMLTESDKEKLNERILDLTAIGTVADCVDLMGENRVLVSKGLEVLNSTYRPGLIALLSVAGIKDKKLDSWNIGFQIGPRLNAAGRMGSAETAYELLVTRDRKKAKVLANRLNEKNIARQADTNIITEEVEKQIEEKGRDKIIFGVCDDKCASEGSNWNEGIIGLVAGKIVSKYYLPTLVITKTQEGFKGSGRSISEFNLVEAIEEASDFLDRYGGHPAACGFSLSESKLPGFIKKMKQIANAKLKDLNPQPRIIIEGELMLKDINEKIMSDINSFAPFGQNNDRPTFMATNATIYDILHMGMDGQHIKLRIKDDNSAMYNALAFGQSKKYEHLKIKDKIDIVYHLDVNEFNGKSEIQLKIVDIRPCDA